MPIYAAVFALDSTIIAVAHGPVITLWDTDSNALLKVLDNVSIQDARKIAFIEPDGRYLVAAGGSSGLAVWDLLSCEGELQLRRRDVLDSIIAVKWASTTARCDKLLSHPSAPLFVTCSVDTHSRTIVSLYSSADQNPLRRRAVSTKIDDICFLPSPPKDDGTALQFVGIANDGEIYRFGDAVKAITSDPVRQVAPTPTTKPESIWQEIFGKDAFIEDLETPLPAPPPRVRKLGRPSEVFDGPSHTMPPVRLLFDAFLEEILSAKPENAEKDEEIVVDGVEYDEGPPTFAVSLPDIQESKTRPVTDADVRDLESFFREVLGTGTSGWLV